MNIRDKLLRRARRTRLESDCMWLILRAKRKEVKRMIRNSEIEFVQNRISECHGKPGAMWKIIRNYAPTSRAPASTVQYTKDIRATADEFNDYFTSVGQKLFLI